MSQVLTAAIVHGSGGFPERNWFPWLKEELLTRGIATTVPKFPTPEGQSLKSWSDTFAREIGDIAYTQMLFGHSIGVALLLNLLSVSATRARATFLVAGFFGTIGHPVYDPMNESFFAKAFDWKRIRQNAGELFVYAGDDDPYVPFQKSIELATLLETELIVVPKAGHLNQDSGFTSFPRLLRDVEYLL